MGTEKANPSKRALVDSVFHIHDLSRQAIFFNNESAMSIIGHMVQELESELLTFLSANLYRFELVTIQDSNRLKLNERYKRSRDTYHVNKDIDKEDSIIHKFLKSRNEKH